MEKNYHSNKESILTIVYRKLSNWLDMFDKKHVQNDLILSYLKRALKEKTIEGLHQITGEMAWCLSETYKSRRPEYPNDDTWVAHVNLDLDTLVTTYARRVTELAKKEYGLTLTLPILKILEEQNAQPSSSVPSPGIMDPRVSGKIKNGGKRSGREE